LLCSAVAHQQSRDPSNSQILLPDQSQPDGETFYLVDLYFRYYNDKPHSLFHEHTFKASVAAGTVSQPVLLAMMGLSARYGITSHDFSFPSSHPLLFVLVLGQ
jgi:hypothetical protein